MTYFFLKIIPNRNTATNPHTKPQSHTEDTHNTQPAKTTEEAKIDVDGGEVDRNETTRGGAATGDGMRETKTTVA